jgi:hypothetical protein
MVEILDIIQILILKRFADVPAVCLLASRCPTVVLQVCTKQMELIKQIFIKPDIREFYEKLFGHINTQIDYTILTANLHRDLNVFPQPS